MNKEELSKLNKNKIMFRWNRVLEGHNNHTKKIIRTKKYKLLKARLLAFLAGDGSVSIRNEKGKANSVHYDISFYPDHPSLTNPFFEAFTYLYIKKPKVRAGNNYFIIKVTSKFACMDLLKISPLGSMTWRVPFNFLSTKECKKEWLRAFFDCESSILKDQIQLQSVNQIGLNEVKELLQEFGIESKIYQYKRKNKNWNTNYLLCIMKKDMRRKFLNTIGFNHVVKKEKLKKLLKPACQN